MKNNKPAELSPLQKMYLELEKIIEPRLLDDFCGYNEEVQGFDIVLATKEIIEDKEQILGKIEELVTNQLLQNKENLNTNGTSEKLCKQILDIIIKETYDGNNNRTI